MYKNSMLLLLSLFFTSFSYGQKQTNMWYFGYNGGLDFNKSPVSSFKNVGIQTEEGISSIADTSGKTLFYTDGHFVLNKTDNQMNQYPSLYLTGDRSTTQSALIVGKPGSTNLFYVFSIYSYGGSLNYSIVDMSKNNGLGQIDATTLNTVLFQHSTEKITAVHHKNGKDIWVIAHEWNTNQFSCWLITNNGISAKPIVSAIGSFHGGSVNNARGYLKVSPDGKHLAAAITEPDKFVEILDFDDQTGIISHPVKIDQFISLSGPYGVEFSPNGHFLYISEYTEPYNNLDGYLYQLPIPAQSGNIANQGILISKGFYFAALQLASNGKIYQAVRYNSFLPVIDFPNKLGAALRKPLACNQYRI